MAEPKYRFKRNDGSSYPAWKEMPLGTLVSDNLDPVPTPREGYRRVGIYCHAKGTFQEDVPAENVLDVDTMYRIHKDNLIVNITFAWEHAVAIVKPEDEGLLVSHRFPEYSFNEGQVPGFYKYLVLRPYFRNQLSLASPGGAGRNRVLNKAQFKKIPVSVPCEEEQQKIADFLSSVDEVITASEEEVANLETQKKAVMKKIFSQEVRFKRADGSDFPEWEYNLFGEIASLMTASIDPSKAGTMHCVELEHLEQGSGQRLGFVEAENQSSNKRLFETGDVLFGKLRPYLRKYWLATEDGCCSSEIWVLRPLSGVLPEYLLAIVSSDDFISVANTSEGTKMPRASWDLVANAEFPVPSFEEQRLVADFLSDFDEAIAAAKKELELWKELKKGLLQQMFV